MLAFLLGPHMLLFGILSPLMMAGQAVSERRSTRRRHGRETEYWKERTTRAHSEATGMVRAEQVLRRQLHGDVSTTLHVDGAPGVALWERRGEDEDALTVRLGWGTARSRVRLIGGDPGEPPPVADVPIGLRLSTVGVLGVCGPRARVLATARALVGQLATTLSPADLRIWLLPVDAGERDWSWLARLPHAVPLAPLDRGGDADVAAVTVLSAVLDRDARPPSGGDRPLPHHLVVLDTPNTGQDLLGMADILRRGPSVGIVVLALTDRPGSLPVECGTVLDLDPDAAPLRTGVLASADHPLELVPDGVGEWWAERLSRQLAPLRDASPTSDIALPHEIGLIDLLGHHTLEPRNIAARWALSTGPEAVVGMGLSEPLSIDLRRDGPHVLIAGTTGSGKSELLQTLIGSLALSCAPDAVGFVLVDYKGGAAFESCVNLPHTLGVVTDLDDHLADRALRSLRAEIRRRERLLAQAEVTDVDAYARRPDLPPLPRLVVVIDEFRVLAEELPSFLDGVVRIAAVGRSLGIHLVLATQRPAGVITPDIRANVNLRIALRVRDQADSRDVIDAPDAALMDARTPGRALSRIAGNGLDPFQVARVTTPPPAPIALRVRPVTSRAPVVGSGSGRSTLDLIAAATRETAVTTGQRAQPAPWLPALSDLVELAEPWVVGGRVSWGRVDLPDRQIQRAWGWDPATGGHVVIGGGPGSGRTTGLRTLAQALGAAYGPHQHHVHVLEGVPGSLSGLGHCAAVGTVVGRDDPRRLQRLLGRLSEEIRWRRSVISANGYATLADWAAVDRAGALQQAPPLLLLVDDWDRWAGPDTADHGAVADQILGLIRDGTAAGLRAVVTGGRSVLFGRVAAIAANHLVLRLADPSELALAGIPASALPVHQPPGRAVCAETLAEIQLGLVREAATPADTSHGTEADAATTGSDVAAQGHRPVLIRPLPLLVDAHSLPDDGNPWLGVGGDLARPVALELAAAGGTFLVAGPAGSGRTSTLTHLAQLAGRGGYNVATVRGAPSRARSVVSDIRHMDLGSADDVRSFLQRPRAVVIADDLLRLAGTDIEAALLAWLASPPPVVSGVLIAAGNTRDLLAGYRGLGAELARRRTGLLLSPQSATDGELFGVPSMKGPIHPGRGVLVRAGQTIDVQVAWHSGRPVPDQRSGEGLR